MTVGLPEKVIQHSGHIPDVCRHGCMSRVPEDTSFLPFPVAHSWTSIPPSVLGLAGLVVLNASDNKIVEVAQGACARGTLRQVLCF